jgi:hypothetical protein
MSDNQSALSRRVRERADADSLPADHQLRVLADKFDAACHAGDAKPLVGAWARLRRAWCEYSGESLL